MRCVPVDDGEGERAGWGALSDSSPQSEGSTGGGSRFSARWDVQVRRQEVPMGVRGNQLAWLISYAEIAAELFAGIAGLAAAR